MKILKRREGENLPKKVEYPPIREVIFMYIGTDEDFNTFLRAIAHDYISNELDDFEDEVH